MPAKLFFYYSAMNAGKSSTLLQASYNYNERGLRTLLFIPKLIGKDQIASRIGLRAPAIQFGPEFDFAGYVQKEIADSVPASSPDGAKHDLGCVLVDEAQFLNKAQVVQLSHIADEMQIPVLCYGLRSDFLGEPFEGSKYLLCYADVLTEIKTICSCGRKATMNQRIRGDGTPLAAGEQVEVGGNERYVGKCRRHFQEGLALANSITKDEAVEPPMKKRKLAEVTPEKKDFDSENSRNVASPPSA
jgi:thymidine kinase